MERVHLFAVDTEMRNEVRDYMIDFLKGEIVSQAFLGLDVKGYAEAKAIIEKCFKHMDEEFKDKSVKPVVNEME